MAQSGTERGETQAPGFRKGSIQATETVPRFSSLVERRSRVREDRMTRAAAD
jgi:hypothetical protein